MGDLFVHIIVSLNRESFGFQACFDNLFDNRVDKYKEWHTDDQADKPEEFTTHNDCKENPERRDA